MTSLEATKTSSTTKLWICKNKTATSYCLYRFLADERQADCTCKCTAQKKAPHSGFP